MKVSPILTTVGAALLSSCPPTSADHPDGFGFQSGYMSGPATSITSSEQLNDDSYAASFYYDAEHNLIYFTGSTYGTYFDSATDLDKETKGAMGMSSLEGGRDINQPHLQNGDCFLGILKLPNSHIGHTPASDEPTWLVHTEESQDSQGNSNKKSQQSGPELIYARRFGTPQNSESCSSILMLPKVNDALLRTDAQLKLTLLGHVNPTPLSSAETNAMGPAYASSYNYEGNQQPGLDGNPMRGVDSQQPQQPQPQQAQEQQPAASASAFVENPHSLLCAKTISELDESCGSAQSCMNDPCPSEEFCFPFPCAEKAAFEAMGPNDRGGGWGGRQRQLRQTLESSESREDKQKAKSGNKKEGSRILAYEGNRGGFLHTISSSPPITQPGRAYGFIVDFDVSLTVDETFSTSSTSASNDSFENAYGALLGGYVLESSPLVYPVAMTQNKRDPNELYVVSMHSDSNAVVLNPEYGSNPVVDNEGHDRADITLGGAGSSGSKLIGGVPKYGTDFYVKVQQLTVTPYEKLMDVEPTPEENVKRTMTPGWGFGFKLNDANDVRPSTIVFVKGRTPNEDLLLLGGTTRKDGPNGGEELDGFITRLNPPAPSPVEDQTFGTSVEIQDESDHQTKRIDSTTGRDETVTAICVPPPDRDGMAVSHVYVVGSTSSDRGTQAQGRDPSLAYILKMRLDDLSTIWKEHLPSIHPTGLGGDVLGEGCAVSPDGSMVYLSGTIDGGSALNTGVPNMNISPIGGKSDVFVVAYDVQFGNIQWAKQLGSVYEDKLARGGGVHADNEGNVIIMGNTRGGMQRPRPSDQNHMSSDVFIMSLSRADGEYVNAPYAGVTVSSSGGATSSASNTKETDVQWEDPPGGGGMSAGGKAGISIIVLALAAGVLLILRRRTSRHRHSRFDASDGDVLRAWDNQGDDFSFNNRSLGGRQSSTVITGRSPGGSMRDAEMDDWDDGTGISRNATWMSGGFGSTRRAGSGDGDNDSVQSAGSSSSRGSRSSYKSQENSDFLSSLRKEANATMNKMVKDSEVDPRLDDGASIKSLLTHYRDAKKGGLIEGDSESVASGGSGGSSGKKASRKKPPPPPPPRKKKDDNEAMSADGLAEFTIV